MRFWICWYFLSLWVPNYTFQYRIHYHDATTSPPNPLTLEPDWHGRGVTSELLRIILDEWVGRWMGIGSVSAVRAPFVSGISPEGGGLARWGEEGDVVV